jgi:molybdate transport system ATP-binding protein
MIIGDNPKGYGQDMVLFGRKKGSGETIWEIKKQIGYFTPGMMLQFKHKDSVENMIISGLVDSVGLYTIPTDFQRHTADAWLQVIGPSFRNASFQSLSFGQQRMVMVVRAMVKQPPLLILDEPTVGLDDENAQLFISLINAIASQKKVAIIYVSHRNEPELQPDYIFELMPGADGSVGRIIKS